MAAQLSKVTFHEKLGTVADKVERVAKLAAWLVEEGVVKGADADTAEQAARLAKADLVTEMVGEFPELQGLMGGYYAEKEGLPSEVSDAIRDHYKPVGQGDDVPTAPVTVAVSLADKLDTLSLFFANGLLPTGSKDPFALRRAALGVLQLLQTSELRLELARAIDFSRRYAIWMVNSDLKPVDFNDDGPIFRNLEFGEWNGRFDLNENESLIEWRNEKGQLQAIDLKLDSSDLLDFFADRLKVQQREAGVRHDLIDAVFSLGGKYDLVRLLARVKALQSYIETAEGADLLAGYKRAANILKKEEWHGIEGEIARTGEEDPLALVDDPDMKAVVDAKMSERHARELSYTPEPAEKSLIEALDVAEPQASEAIEKENFEAAMSALASLRAPIDAFFEAVTVNDPDPDKRAARLDLLARFRAAVHNVADFSKIEG